MATTTTIAAFSIPPNQHSDLFDDTRTAGSMATSSSSSSSSSSSTSAAAAAAATAAAAAAAAVVASSSSTTTMTAPPSSSPHPPPPANEIIPEPRKNGPNWAEFYKNGFPTEVIVISDSEDEDRVESFSVGKKTLPPLSHLNTNDSHNHENNDTDNEGVDSHGHNNNETHDDDDDDDIICTGEAPSSSSSTSSTSSLMSSGTTISSASSNSSYTYSTTTTTTTANSTHNKRRKPKSHSPTSKSRLTVSSGSSHKHTKSAVTSNSSTTTLKRGREPTLKDNRKRRRSSYTINYIPPRKPIIKCSEVHMREIFDKRKLNISTHDKEGYFSMEVPCHIADGRFKLTHVLGQGTFGKVFAAYDFYHRRHCAIKVIRAIPKYRDASKIELRVLTTIREYDPKNHNRCIHVRENFLYRGHVCIVTDLLSMSLYDFLKSNKYLAFPASHVQSFARQLIKSVSFLHDLGLIHTDLKPENILLRSSESNSLDIPSISQNKKKSSSNKSNNNSNNNNNNNHTRKNNDNTTVHTNGRTNKNNNNYDNNNNDSSGKSKNSTSTHNKRNNNNNNTTTTTTNNDNKNKNGHGSSNTAAKKSNSNDKDNNKEEGKRMVLKDTTINLIDFGSAIFADENHNNVVSTRHYRAPEIILGIGWSFPCDIWSIGCILVELCTGDALFQTHEDLEHLALMEKITGRQIDKSILRLASCTKTGMDMLDVSSSVRINYPNKNTSKGSLERVHYTKSLGSLLAKTRPMLPKADDEYWRLFKDLLDKMLVYDPRRRITAREALNHPWLTYPVDNDDDDDDYDDDDNNNNDNNNDEDNDNDNNNNNDEYEDDENEQVSDTHHNNNTTTGHSSDDSESDEET